MSERFSFSALLLFLGFLHVIVIQFWNWTFERCDFLVELNWSQFDLTLLGTIMYMVWSYRDTDIIFIYLYIYIETLYTHWGQKVMILLLIPVLTFCLFVCVSAFISVAFYQSSSLITTSFSLHENVPVGLINLFALCCLSVLQRCSSFALAHYFFCLMWKTSLQSWLCICGCAC